MSKVTNVQIFFGHLWPKNFGHLWLWTFVTLDFCDFGHLWLWTFVTKFIWWVLLEVSRSIRLQWSHTNVQIGHKCPNFQVSHKCPNLQKSVTNVQNFGHLWQKILIKKIKSKTLYWWPVKNRSVFPVFCININLMTTKNNFASYNNEIHWLGKKIINFGL